MLDRSKGKRNVDPPAIKKEMLDGGSNFVSFSLSRAVWPRIDDPLGLKTAHHFSSFPLFKKEKENKNGGLLAGHPFPCILRSSLFLEPINAGHKKKTRDEPALVPRLKERSKARKWRKESDGSSRSFSFLRAGQPKLIAFKRLVKRKEKRNEDGNRLKAFPKRQTDHL